MDFPSFYESQMLLGEISEIFSAPVIPKMIIVGLTGEEDENLRLFKEILTKALDNLFVIEFCEQFIPESSKLPSCQVHYRNHEVKETWMYKMRHDRPAILIDFRLISEYIFNEDDSILSEQLLQTKYSLPEAGPVYLVWLAGKGISSQRVTSIAKQAKLDKSAISVIELWDDASMIMVSLKQRIQECFECSRTFYQNLGKKYKKSVIKTSKFIHPWMPTVYYYYKLAVSEEFRGDFQSSLKYYHTILAKFKELIEATTEERCQMINYLRKTADICFMRLSFLLFRLNQCGEAEFGLFRYLTYFSNGLCYNEQLMWRYNMSRSFARQLIKSSVWLKENDFLMRGAAHFLIYSLKTIKNYSVYEEFYQVQEMKMQDLSDALESALKSPQLTHIVDYLQFLIIEHYFSQSLMEESGPFINYLKESDKIKGWKLIEEEILSKSILLSKSQGNYKMAVVDTWRRIGITSLNSSEDSGDFEDWCLIHAQMFQEPIRLNFSSTDLINCNVKFHKKDIGVFEGCQLELNIYTKKRCLIDLFQLESIGIFFDNEQLEPVIFVCDSDGRDKECDIDGRGISDENPTVNLGSLADNPAVNLGGLAGNPTVNLGSLADNPTVNLGSLGRRDLRLIPGEILKLKAAFYPSKVGKMKISFVTMQLKRPFLALQFDESAFLHQQNSEKFSEESLEFVRICEKTHKTNLSLRVEALRPRIKVEIMIKDDDELVLAFNEISVSVKISNLVEQALITEFVHENEKYEIKLGPKEVQILSLKHKITGTDKTKIRIKTWTRFNLELIEVKFTEICNFDIFEEEFYSNFIKPVNPFKITLKSNNIRIKAHCPIEFISLTGSSDSFIMESGERKTFKVDTKVITTSFRLIQDPSKQVHVHTIK